MRIQKLATLLMFMSVSCTPILKTVPAATAIITSAVVVYPTQVYGIALHYYYDVNTFFPPEWRLEPIKCSGSQFKLTEMPRVGLDIEEFASEYSPDFIKHNLTDIYLLSELQCYGRYYGGTNGQSSLYISVGREEQGYTDQFLQGTLHSEFSSILMRNYSFPAQDWILINGESFTYSENAIQVVEQDGIRDQTEELLKAGFLTEYAKTSMENDFNMFTEWLFSRQMELCGLRAKYENIDKKASLAIEFYKSIDSGVSFSLCK